MRKTIFLLLLLLAALPAWSRLTTRTETCQKVIDSLTPEQKAQNPQIQDDKIIDTRSCKFMMNAILS